MCTWSSARAAWQSLTVSDGPCTFGALTIASAATAAATVVLIGHLPWSQSSASTCDWLPPLPRRYRSGRASGHAGGLVRGNDVGGAVRVRPARAAEQEGEAVSP